MTRYPIEPRRRKYVKGYEFLKRKTVIQILRKNIRHYYKYRSKCLKTKNQSIKQLIKENN